MKNGRQKAWMKFMENLNIDKELLDTYRKLRLAFKREGWTEKDLEKPPYYPMDIMSNFQKFSRQHDEIFSLLRSYGLVVDHNEFVDYLKERLKLINDETPLDGNKDE